jgi:hypothetical protein
LKRSPELNRHGDTGIVEEKLLESVAQSLSLGRFYRENAGEDLANYQLDHE